ncbi:MAG: hypothetical protein Q7K43_04490 [Candidatus Woesearchaeota archaeon]|nr:hypothetical protein [Candidatus Woesearchaeota archaeon]
MTNMTLALPDELSQKMKQHTDIRWTEIARQAIEKRLHDLDLMNRLAAKSRLTSKDVEELSETLKKNAARRLSL